MRPLGQKRLNFSKTIKANVKTVVQYFANFEMKAAEIAQKNGYKYVGIRKNYYKNSSGREDGLIFTKHLKISKLNSLYNQMTYMITSILKIKN